MATAILSSQNSLNHGFDHQTLTHRNPNSRIRRRRKRSATASQSTVVESPAANTTNLVMGQVKILKRGETLSSFRKKESSSYDDTRRAVLKMNDVDLIVASTNRLGPEPEIVQKQIGCFKGLVIFAGGYAGAGCSVSPSPSSVPIPCFLGKNKLFE